MKTPIIIAGGAIAVLLAGGIGFAIAEANDDDGDPIPRTTASTEQPRQDDEATDTATDGADDRTDDRDARDQSDQQSKGRINLRDDDDDRDNLTGETLQKAADAALAHTGGGTVTDADKADRDDRHAYEVEVTMGDGREVDIDLDEKFAIVDVDSDD